MTLADIRHTIPDMKPCQIYRKEWLNSEETCTRSIGVGKLFGELTINFRPFITQEDICANDWELIKY